MQADETSTKDIAPKYMAMIERFNAVPKKSFKHTKMVLDFTWWFRNNKDKLTEDEKAYLQANICEVNDDNLWSYNY